MQAAFAGIDVGERKISKEEAEQVQKDPESVLKSFPEDVKYFNEQECRWKEQVSTRAGSALLLERRWPEYRTECCLGKYGKAARRCSMNHILWGRYLESVQQGHPLLLGIVRAMVEFDFLRRKLYPPGYKGDGTESPPPEYLAQLQKEGTYSDIMARLTQITRGTQHGSEG